MNSLDIAFEVDEPSVIYEESDGEVVLVDLRNGKYYRLRGDSSFTFSLLISGRSLERMVLGLQENDATVGQFLAVIDDMRQRQLIRERPVAFVEEVAPWIFREFHLEVFEDLQEILKLDPIHESDPELGWPSARN